MSRSTPVISLIGRPNVGKSTIFNRLLRNSAKAIAFNKPGVTRDRHYGILRFDTEDQDALLIDTGGFYPEYNDPDENLMFSVMAQQARLAIRESDLVLIVADVREGLLPFDEAIVNFTRKEKKDLWLVVNKYDTDTQAGLESEFYSLGLENVLLVSAEHNRGLEDLKDRMLAFTKQYEKDQAEDVGGGVKPNYPLAGKVSLIGAPNAGKSTLLNQLLGSERAVVSSVAGTTIDPIEGFMDLNFEDEANLFDKNQFFFKKDAVSLLAKIEEEFTETSVEADEFENEVVEAEEEATASTALVQPFRSVMMIDTAGIRRKSHIEEEVEAQSVYRSLRAITDSDVVIYLIDGDKGITHQDKKLMGVAIEKGKSLIIAINKIDLNEEVFSKKKEKKEFLLDLKFEIPWLSYCEPVFLSAKKAWGITRLKDEIKRLLLIRKRYIPTGPLNKTLNKLFEQNPVAIKGNYHTKLKLKYAAMVKAAPPTFLLFTNRSKGIPVNYRRYLVNGIRNQFDLPNTPVHVVFRKENEKRVTKSD